MPKQSQSVRTPSLDLEVSVRHADPGLVVPPELTAFVIASYVDERLDDWLLTNDAIAFGSDTVVQAFHRWRATWEVRWTLDSISSVERLLAIASTEPDLVDNAVVATLEPILAEVGDGMTGLVGPNAAADLAAAVGELRDAVRNRNLVGVGFVNATPGYEGTGLARAWSGSGGREVIAADHAMEVVLDPETGLGIELFLMGGRRATTIHLVEVEHDHALVHYLDDDGEATLELSHDSCRPLAWIVPNASIWRVVTVPEVLVWARSFAGLAEAAEAAAASEQPMRFTTQAAHVLDFPTDS